MIVEGAASIATGIRVTVCCVGVIVACVAGIANGANICLDGSAVGVARRLRCCCHGGCGTCHCSCHNCNCYRDGCHCSLRNCVVLKCVTIQLM